MLPWIILIIYLNLIFNTSVYATGFHSMGREPITVNRNVSPIQRIAIKVDNQVTNPSVKVDVKHSNVNSTEIVKDVESPMNNNTKNVLNHKNNVEASNVKKYSKDVLQSGALLRGFYVFIGLSAVVLFYFICRSYRLRKGAQATSTVRKYGITARRSDLEMRRLELDDEDDDTIFEINQNINR